MNLGKSIWARAVQLVSLLITIAAVAACGGDGETSSGAGGTGAGGPGAPAFLASYPLEAKFPEGGIYDPVGHAFFVGSLADGSVHRVDAQTGKDEVFFQESAPGAWWTLGMAVDAQRKRLWVCAMEDRRETGEDPPYDGYIWVFDLELGTRMAVFPLADAAPDASCTDVALTGDGTAYVTDRDFGNVYKVDIDAGPSLFATDAKLESSLVGQNAVVVLPDESALLIVVYVPSLLVRVDLKDASVVEVDVQGSFEDTALLAGADGMTYVDDALYVAFTSELVKVSPLAADWSSASAVDAKVTNGMTDVVATPEGLYLLNGQAVRFALDQETDPFALTRFSGEL